tara:strand:- start:80 stop:439 length:360 start_codon:yes stop_codon:yes gene_type:complete
MKKTILTIATIGLLLTSCKKEDTLAPKNPNDTTTTVQSRLAEITVNSKFNNVTVLTYKNSVACSQSEDLVSGDTLTVRVISHDTLTQTVEVMLYLDSTFEDGKRKDLKLNQNITLEYTW